MGTSGDGIVSKLEYQTYTSEFDSHLGATYKQKA